MPDHPSVRLSVRPSDRPTIHLLFTGGTISMQRDERAGGNVPTHSGAVLVGYAPELAEISVYEIEDWGRYPACHLGQDKLWELVQRLRALTRGVGTATGEAPAGIVITHGTDTIEETAYLLARTVEPDVPIVITGAMRTSTDAGWDGPRNLTDAARVAADPASRGRGTMVVFGGKILAGREAVKVHATDLDAFSAPHGSVIGQVSEQGVRYLTPGARDQTSRLSPPSLRARIALIPMITGDQGEVLDAARPMYDGAVVVGYGSGNCPPGAVPAMQRWLAEGKPLVLASRCLQGQVTPTYAFPGGGGTLLRMGLTPAGPRTPSQARMELAICLSAGVGYGGER